MSRRAAFELGLAQAAGAVVRDDGRELMDDPRGAAAFLLGRSAGAVLEALELAVRLEVHQPGGARAAAAVATSLEGARRALTLAGRAIGLPPAVEPPLAELRAALACLDVDDGCPRAARDRVVAALPKLAAAL